MTKLQRQQFEMFTCVQEWGKTHRGQLPEGSAAARAIQTLDAVVAELKQFDSERIVSATKGKGEKESARQALMAQFLAMTRTAKVLARDLPGIDVKFMMPKLRSDVALLSAARAQASQRSEIDERFVAHGLPDLNGLNAIIEAFELASRGRQVTKNDRIGTRVTIGEAIKRGLGSVRSLEAFVANTMHADRTITAKWKQARRIHRCVRPPAADVPVSATVVPEQAPAVASEAVLPKAS